MSYLESRMYSRNQWRKILRGVPSEEDLEAFRQEVKLYKKLGKNVSQLYS